MFYLIDPFIPYTISVAGATIKGRGEAVSSAVFFTQQGSKIFVIHCLLSINI